MELIMALAVIIMILVLLGVPVSAIAAGIWWLMAGLSALCELFFLIALVIVLCSKKKQAVFLSLEKGKRGAVFAHYEMDGTEYKNMFPTDAVLKDIFYRKKEVKVRVCKLGKRTLILDKMSLAVIALGFPAFGLMTLAMTGFF